MNIHINALFRGGALRRMLDIEADLQAHLTHCSLWNTLIFAGFEAKAVGSAIIHEHELALGALRAERDAPVRTDVLRGLRGHSHSVVRPLKSEGNAAPKLSLTPGARAVLQAACTPKEVLALVLSDRGTDRILE